MDWMTWYNGLDKPSWTPAPATIGLIWQILYPIILISFGYVFVQAFRGKVGWIIVSPFAINLVANLIFTSRISSGSRWRLCCNCRSHG